MSPYRFRPLVASLMLVGLCGSPLHLLAQPASAPAAQPAVHPDVVRLIDVWLASTVRFEAIPALSVTLAKGQTTVHAAGYGHVDAARKLPATADTIYSICSISKLFTSVAIMQLVEQGKLRLDDELAQWVPEFGLKQRDESSGPATIRGALMHAAGLPREAVGEYWSAGYAFPDRATLLQGLAGQEMVSPALSRYQYSNLGMAMLGEIVAKASGKPYNAYVRDAIIQPLALATTEPRLPNELLATRMAVGFSARKGDGSRDRVPAFETGALLPAAGFSSTMRDLGEFAKWQLRVLKTGKTEVIRAATLREMQRVQWTDPDGRTLHGLGFALSREGSDLAVGHTGSCPGHRSVVTVLPGKELGVALAINAHTPAPAPIARQVMLLAQRAPTAEAASTREPAAVAFNAADFVGRYSTQPWSAEAEVLRWGTDLAILSIPTLTPSADLTVLRHVGGDRFRAVREDRSLGVEFVFERGADGRVKQYRLWATVAPRLD